MSAVDELIAFLRTQLDEDERVARAANPAPWRRITGKTWLDSNTIFGGSYMGDQEKLRNVASLEISWLPDENADHITRWDPARVLAEVEAKRRIIALHHPVDPCDAHDATQETIACDTLLALAQPYAGRTAWREEWSA